jgi:hypothetical protein
VLDGFGDGVAGDFFGGGQGGTTDYTDYTDEDAIPEPDCGIRLVMSRGRFGFLQRRTHLDTTTIGANEPLSLALSPLRGARELPNRVVVVARCALQRLLQSQRGQNGAQAAGGPRGLILQYH